MEINSFKDMYLAELQELASVQSQLEEAQLRMAGMASHPELKDMLARHREETQTQKDRIESVLKKHRADPKAHTDNRPLRGRGLRHRCRPCRPARPARGTANAAPLRRAGAAGRRPTDRAGEDAGQSGRRRRLTRVARQPARGRRCRLTSATLIETSGPPRRQAPQPER